MPLSLHSLSVSLGAGPQSALLALLSPFISWMSVEWSWLSLSLCARLHPFAHHLIQTHGFNCSLRAYDSRLYPFPPTPTPIFFFLGGQVAHFFLLPSHPGFNMTRLNYGSFAWSLFCPKSPPSLLMTDPSFPSFRSKSWGLSYSLSHVPPLVHPRSLTSPITCFQLISSTFLLFQPLDLLLFSILV